MKSLQRTMKAWWMRASLAILAAGICVVAFTMNMTSHETAGSDHQPKRVIFSHQFHVNEAGVACADCHTAAVNSTLASDNLFATMEACRSCHEDQMKSNCTYCHTSADTATYAASPIPKRELVFSHKFHIDKQKVECEICHKKLDDAAALTGTLVPEMAVCVTCHNDVKASNACEQCHTNFASLRPKDHNRSDFVNEHKQLARIDNAKCGTCHTQESCAECHNGSELMKVNVPGTDLVSPHSPRLMANDRGQGMRLTKVHDLNFRYTHGIEARGKISECQTCHSDETFCTTCHIAGGNVNQGSFKPKSHSEAGFVLLGVGSGGGQHAKLAKRDIESCAACHDPEAADPACIQCHMDPDGIKGTDPKTHEKGFMGNDHGYWHTDPGANCFMCHTDANAHPGGVKGQKFCGYCHR